MLHTNNTTIGKQKSTIDNYCTIWYTITMDNPTDSSNQLPAITPEQLPQGQPAEQQSIWDTTIFPTAMHAASPYGFTPKDLRQLFLDWGTTSTWLPNLCKDRNIRYQSIWAIIDQYPEVKQLYDQMHQRKLEHGLHECDERLQTVETTINTGKGIQQNSAIVRREEALAKFRLERAKLLIPQYAPHTSADVRLSGVFATINANIDVSKVDHRDIRHWLGMGDTQQ